MLIQLLISCKEQNKTNQLISNNIDTTINFPAEITDSKVYTTSSSSEVKLQLTAEKILFTEFQQPLEIIPTAL